MKISIIVPVYNREKYIEKCLRSLIAQSYEKIEIIVVDNNSKDDSVAIIKKLAKEDTRIKLYGCKKQGVSAARNYGLAKATGDYVTFVDSDDYCLPHMIQLLSENARENDSDISVCAIDSRNESGEKLPEDNSKSQYQGRNCVKRYLCAPAAVYGKLFKTEILKKYQITFREDISLAEDLAFVTEVAAHTNKISFIDDACYVYISQDDSLMHALNPEREYQIFNALGYIYGVYDKEADLLDKYHNEIERMFIANLVLSSSTRYMLPENDEIFYKQAIAFMRLHFPKWHKNKYYAKRDMKVKLFFWLYRYGYALKFRKIISRNRS